MRYNDEFEDNNNYKENGCLTYFVGNKLFN